MAAGQANRGAGDDNVIWSSYLVGNASCIREFGHPTEIAAEQTPQRVDERRVSNDPHYVIEPRNSTFHSVQE